MPTQEFPDHDWPGKRFGLPDTGPRSVARFGRRLGAVVIDWAIATGISFLITREQNPGVTLLAFAALQYIFIMTLSGASDTWRSVSGSCPSTPPGSGHSSR